MHLRNVLLLCCLAVVGCTSGSTEIVDATGAEQVERDEPAASPTAAPPTAAPAPTAAPEPAAPEPATPEPTATPEPASSSMAFEELAALLAASDFQLDSNEEQCLSDALPGRLSEDQAIELIDGSDENLEPNDPLTESVVAVYEELGACLGAERLLDVLLEPEFDPETHACALATFPEDQDQIDAMVALMTVALADLPEPPGRYSAIFDQFNESCG